LRALYLAGSAWPHLAAGLRDSPVPLAPHPHGSCRVPAGEDVPAHPYVCIALSDVLDGLSLARQGPQPGLGQVDAGRRYCLYQFESYRCGLAGRVGFWSVGVAILGGRFLLRNLGHQPTLEGRLMEDRLAKPLGDLLLLVGAVALELSVEGEGGRWVLARVGDAGSSTRFSYSAQENKVS